MFRRIQFLAMVLIVCCTGFGPAVIAQEATSTASGPTVLPPDAEVEGLSQAEWHAREWQWVLSFPNELSPYTDTTGERCNLGQSGPVFFLVGGDNGIERDCTVPLGAIIYVTAGSASCSTAEPPPFYGSDEQELRECALGHDEQINMSSTNIFIDNVAVSRLTSHRSVTPMFSLVLPEDNLFGARPGVASAIAVGYQVMVQGLTEGEHTIVISGNGITVTYHLLVQGPQLPGAEATPVATPAT